MKIMIAEVQPRHFCSYIISFNAFLEGDLADGTYLLGRLFVFPLIVDNSQLDSPLRNVLVVVSNPGMGKASFSVDKVHVAIVSVVHWS